MFNTRSYLLQGSWVGEFNLDSVWDAGALSRYGKMNFPAWSGKLESAGFSLYLEQRTEGFAPQQAAPSESRTSAAQSREQGLCSLKACPSEGWREGRKPRLQYFPGWAEVLFKIRWVKEEIRVLSLTSVARPDGFNCISPILSVWPIVFTCSQVTFPSPDIYGHSGVTENSQPQCACPHLAQIP